MYEFYKLFSHYLSDFPKGKRYTLGQKIDEITIDVIELIITAGYSPREQKLSLLNKISVKLDLLKILIRLASETKALENNKYQNLAAQLIEVGRMLGGWIKNIK